MMNRKSLPSNTHHPGMSFSALNRSFHFILNFTGGRFAQIFCLELLHRVSDGRSRGPANDPLK
jgi:hypothetical protein